MLALENSADCKNLYFIAGNMVNVANVFVISCF